MAERRHDLFSWPVLTGIVLCLVVRLGYGLLSPQDYEKRPLLMDGWGGIGLSMLQGKGMTLDGETPTAMRGPVCPAILAAWFASFGVSRASVVVLQSFLDTLTAVLLALAVLRFGGGRKATGAGVLIWAFYFPQLFYITRAMSEPLFTVLLMLCFWLLSRSRAPSYGAMAASGVVMGLAALTRPVAMLLLAAVAVPRWDSVPSRAWSKRALYLLVAVAVVLPWGFRNARVMGRFMLGSMNGKALYLSTYCLDQPGAPTHDPRNADFARVRAEQDLEAQGVDIEEFSELERDRWFMRTALANIRAYPLGYLREAVNNALSMLFGFYDFRFPSPAYTLVGLLHGAVYVLAALGAWRWRRRFFHPYGLLILMMLVLNTGAYAAVIGVVRFNMPMIPLLLIPGTLALSGRESSRGEVDAGASFGQSRREDRK